ncbi:MAG: hypothetical protein R3B98_01650 [Hyphomonas sp.]
MNLLELPVLFYVLCLMIYVTGRLTELQLGLAWAYVACASSTAACTSPSATCDPAQPVALSNLTLMIMWLLFFFGPRPGS